MELGGNKNAQAFYEKNGMYQDGKPNHKAPQLAKYKADLLKKVEAVLGTHQVQTQGSATFTIDMKGNVIEPFGKTDKQFASENLFENKVNNPFSLQEETKVNVAAKAKPLMMGGGVMQQESATFGIGTLGMKAQQSEVKTLNAKKLDVAFDNDDFFNSFEPTTATSSTQIQKSVSVPP